MIDRCGESKLNNFGSKMIISEYNGNKNITVVFPEYNNWAIITSYSLFKLGEVKCPYERRVFNIGYLGVGKYKTCINKKKTTAYVTWQHIIQRCYHKENKYEFIPYKDCTVCDDWHNFQNFAEWFENNYYEIENETMCIDKDILVKDNKLYSPETCLIVPNRINCLILRNKLFRNGLPIGVSYDKSRNKYKAQCKDINCKNKFLGRYDTIEEAFSAYKYYKENLIKEVADMYKDVIPKQAYKALLNYKIEITD